MLYVSNSPLPLGSGNRLRSDRGVALTANFSASHRRFLLGLPVKHLCTKSLLVSRIPRVVSGSCLSSKQHRVPLKKATPLGARAR
jgi:hypothetical protein